MEQCQPLGNLSTAEDLQCQPLGNLSTAEDLRCQPLGSLSTTEDLRCQPLGSHQPCDSTHPPCDGSRCQALYYRGKYRGQKCGKKVFENGLCERHLNCKHAQAKDEPKRCKANLRSGDQCPNVGYYTSGCCPRHNYKKNLHTDEVIGNCTS